MKRKILHMLQWRLQDIKNVLHEVKEQGFTAIQTSPLQGTRCDNDFRWWILYQPINFEIGNSQIGSRDDLIELCEEAHKIGLEIYVDVVLRHVASDEGDPNIMHSATADYIKPYVKYLDECKDHNNRYETTMKRVGLPFVDYTEESVQSMHKAYLGDLKACGVDGFRVDMLKHFALPKEGCNYLTEVYGLFKDMYLYGEVLFTSKEILDSYSEYMDVLTDCRTLSDESKAVYFFESHDSFLTLKLTTNMTFDHMMYEWNKLVNESKANCVFYTRPFSDIWKSKEVKEINLKNV